MPPMHNEMAVEESACDRRHAALDRILFDHPEGVLPRLRAVELFTAKVAMAAALGSFFGGGLMSLIVGVVVWKITKG